MGKVKRIDVDGLPHGITYLTCRQAEAPDAAEWAVTADTVIVALGAGPNRDLAAALAGNVGEVRNTCHSAHSGAGGVRLV
jgi:hypothetical protein